jgi:hypothetical protein
LVEEEEEERRRTIGMNVLVLARVCRLLSQGGQLRRRLQNMFSIG